MKTPLESLISLKRWEEDEAKNLFAMARKELDDQDRRLADLEENFGALRKRMTYSENEAVSIDEIQKLNGQMEHLFKLLERQKALVAEGRTRMEEAMKILSDASKERKTYEKVDEKHKEAERGEVRKKEQKGIDEHAVMRHKQK
ncbi:MAG TPA: flagellar export protein FliJ [Dissulfurispiraceae bacterium]|nr:flagellar export protein FliJ [Dissulfurispiraceae bacterium]